MFAGEVVQDVREVWQIGDVVFRLCVIMFNSIAIKKPKTVTIRAEVFRQLGMVIWGTSKG